MSKVYKPSLLDIIPDNYHFTSSNEPPNDNCKTNKHTAHTASRTNWMQHGHTKGYASVIVFLVTKKVHLELISDMTSDAFLAALDRFISRRGPCTDMYSDNGTNFVGADNQLKIHLESRLSGNNDDTNGWKTH